MHFSLQALKREVRVWTKLSHPNVTPFYGFCTDIGRPEIPSLVSPLYEHGNIMHYLKTNPNIDKLNLVCLIHKFTCITQREVPFVASHLV